MRNSRWPALDPDLEDARGRACSLAELAEPAKLAKCTFSFYLATVARAAPNMAVGSVRVPVSPSSVRPSDSVGHRVTNANCLVHVNNVRRVSPYVRCSIFLGSPDARAYPTLPNGERRE